MAPINLPDGTEVSEVILPDGTSASEVVAPDGRTVFGAIPDNRVDNFEDGDITVSLKSNWSGWNGDTGALSAQQTTVLAGEFSAEHTASGGTFSDVTATRDTPDTPSEVQVLFRADSRNGNNTDGFEYRIENSGASVANISLRSDGNIRTTNTDSIGSWSLDTTYLLRLFKIDYSNDQYDMEVVDQSDGSVVASLTNESFVSSASEVDGIFLRSDANDGSGQTSYWDNVDWGTPS